MENLEFDTSRSEFKFSQWKLVMLHWDSPFTGRNVFSQQYNMCDVQECLKKKDQMELNMRTCAKVLCKYKRILLSSLIQGLS